MKKLLISLAILALPAVAHAAAGNGVDLAWQNCVLGTGATIDRTFNCTGNSTNNLIFTFKIDQNLPGFTALTAYVNINDETSTDAAAALSPFWHYEQGGCNRNNPTFPTGIAMSSTLAAACDVDVFQDIDQGGSPVIGFAYGADAPPGKGLFIAAVANGAALPLTAGQNYFALQLQFNTRNRTGGPGGASCSGCPDKVALVWNTATLESNDGHPDVNLTGPEKGPNCCTGVHGPGACVTVNGARGNTCDATPVRNRTWGSVKALYR